MNAPFVNKNILWSQKANSNSSTFKNFGYFLYEFVGARYTVLAFIGLFNVATFNLDYYSQILAGGIAVFLFYIISDAFSVFWNGINLKYLVTTDSIIYRWGVIRDHELIIPYNKITKISSFYGKDEKRCAIIFDNLDSIRNRDFGFYK